MAGRKRGASKSKGVRIEFRGSKLDAARLSALARADELTTSEVLRRLVREETERRKCQRFMPGSGKPDVCAVCSGPYLSHPGTSRDDR